MRNLLTVAGAGALLTAGGIALASADSGSSSANHSRRHLTEHQILRIAQRAAANSGDPHPRLIQHSEGTRHEANLVDSGDLVPGKQWSYLIAERGHFVLRDVSTPPGAPAPHGSVLTLIVNASSGQITDLGVGNRYPDLAKLGPVHTDLRRSS